MFTHNSRFSLTLRFVWCNIANVVNLMFSDRQWFFFYSFCIFLSICICAYLYSVILLSCFIIIGRANMICPLWFVRPVPVGLVEVTVKYLIITVLSGLTRVSKRTSNSSVPCRLKPLSSPLIHLHSSYNFNQFTI